jgi:hypothetical protein
VLPLPMLDSLRPLADCGLTLAVMTGIQDAAQIGRLAELLARHSAGANRRRTGPRTVTANWRACIQVFMEASLQAWYDTWADDVYQASRA